MIAFLVFIIQYQTAVCLDKFSPSKGCCFVEPQEKLTRQLFLLVVRMNIFLFLNYQHPLIGEMSTVRIIAVKYLHKWPLLCADRVEQRPLQVSYLYIVFLYMLKLNEGE